MPDVIRIVLSLSLSGSLLFLITLGLSRLLKGRFSKTWHYYVWLLVILRFLVPVAPQVNLVGAVFQAIPVPQVEETLPQGAGSHTNTNPQSGYEAPAPEAADPAPAKASFADTFAALLRWSWVAWLGVAIGLLIRKITLYQSFATYIKAGNTEVSDPEVLNRLAEVCETLGIRWQIGLYENPLTATPLMLGILRPSVVLSSTNISASDFRYIMLHELTHYRRGDILYKWLVQVALCLHWFNPFAYWLAREVGTACELSCDEAVIRRLDHGAQQAYGNVLIESLKNPGTYKQVLAGVTLSENAQSVKERLLAIMHYRKMSSKTAVLSALAALLITVGGVALGAVTPPALAAQSIPPEISLEGKPEAYRLVAQMREVDTLLSIADYNEAVQAICEEAGTNIFAALADSEIVKSTDPLYAFSSGTLARTSGELFAAQFPDTERPMVFGFAEWERYATEEEKAAEQGDYNDEEWQAFLEATKDDPEYPVSMMYVSYMVYYDILDPQGLTIDERDEMLDAVMADMQRFIEGFSEEEVFADSFQEAFAAELQRLTQLHATAAMTMEGELSSAEGYRNGEPIF